MDDGVEMQRTISTSRFRFYADGGFEVKLFLAAILNMGELRFTGVQATLSNATLSADRVSTVENLLGLEPSTLPHVLLYCTLSVSGHVKFSLAQLMKLFASLKYSHALYIIDSSITWFAV